jgi:predicted amidophosphoribosyltransferase
MKKYPKPHRGKYVYCSDCWEKLNNEICFCIEYSKEKPYFCGNCNHHVSGISIRKLNPILKMLKKAKIEVPTKYYLD